MICEFSHPCSANTLLAYGTPATLAIIEEALSVLDVPVVPTSQPGRGETIENLLRNAP